MRRLRSIDRLVGPVLFLVAGTVVVLAFGARLAAAAHENRELAPPIPCAVVENFAGSVQLMDSSRTRIVEASPGGDVSCGGWVSVVKGWASFVHRDGFRIHLSADSFAQFPDGNPDGKGTGDSVVLYKGQVYGKAANGSTQLNIVTANSRARIHDASAIVYYNDHEEETQLIALRGPSTLENRFQGARKIRLNAGEASELNFRQQRVVPSLPRALSQASLKPKLSELHVGEPDQAYALKKASERSDRKFASAESVKPVAPQAPNIWDNGGKKISPRKPASLEFAADAAPSAKGAESEAARRYRATEAAEKESNLLQTHLAHRLTGGQDVNHGVLYPRKDAHGRKPVSLEVEDPTDKLDRAARGVEDREKKKLIEELSQIRLE